MDAEFGGRQLKDQPAVGRVVALDGIPAEHVAQCLAQPLSLARVEEHVRADDRHAVMLRLECGISPRVRTFAVTGRLSRSSTRLWWRDARPRGVRRAGS